MRVRLHILGTLAAALCLAAAVGCTRRDHQSGQVVLAVGDRANAHVTLTSDGSNVAAAWAATGERGTDVFFAVSSDGGAHFSAPVRVNDIEGDATANGEQPPRVTLHGREVSVVWVSKRTGIAAIRSTSSNDGGRTFAAARTITPAGITGARGWESATVSDAGVIHAAWLDGRNAAPKSADHTRVSHHHGSGDMRQDIFHAMWRGFEPPIESLVATDVCFCCKTAVVSRDDSVYVGWRHLFEGGVRDIAVARSIDGGRFFFAPVRVSPDNWKIDACPDDGPAMALTSDGRLHVVWPTLVNDPDKPRLAIFHAVSIDRGRSFSPRERIDGARGTDPAHPRVATTASGEPVFVWDELTNGRRQVAVRWGTDAVQVISDGRAASYPAVAEAGDHAIAAWTDQSGERSEIRIRRVPLSPRAQSPGDRKASQ